MKTFFQLIGIGIAFALVALLFVLGFVWIFAGFGIFIVLFAVFWAAGLPITVKKNGKIIGHLKRTKFYPLWSKY